ncbi:MAG: uracil-DNA glycosylase [Bradymonadia bacterium]
MSTPGQPAQLAATSKINLEPGWLEVLGPEFDQPYMRALKAFLVEERQHHQVFPPGRDMFNAFNLTGFDQVRVVILGQDPYHGRGQAHGLCFSVRRGVRPPPSLVNIFKELNDDLGVPTPRHGELTHWAEQGVLLLNTVLSVRAHAANSHREKGWEQFTDRAIKALNAQHEGLVFVLWGAAAGRKAAMIDRHRHLILKSPHPSPYSADRGFFGCRHFSQINNHLVRMGEQPVDWSLPD